MLDIIKQHINVGTLGHVDHGKTTLSAALSRLSMELYKTKAKDYNAIDNAPEERTRGVTINASHIEYETAKYHVSHVDCPGHADYIKNAIAGASQLDLPILVVSAEDGCMPQTREHVNLIKSISDIKDIIVFINKCDLVSEEQIEYVQMETDDLLQEKGIKGTYVHGSALLGATATDEAYQNKYAFPAMKQLADTIDSIANPERDFDKPFLMYVSDVRSVQGRGTVLTGRVTFGIAKKGDELLLIGMGKKNRKVIISSMEYFHKELLICRAGDDVGILPRCADISSKDDVRKGEALLHESALKQGIVTITNHFRAKIYVLTAQEGGRSTAFFTGFMPQLFIETAAITSTIRIVDADNNPINTGMLMPGDDAEITFELQMPMALSASVRFAGRENKKTVLSGVITQLLPVYTAPKL